MTKRELTEGEKKIITKNIEFIKENLAYDEAIAKQVDVQIEIAPILYQHQIEEMKRKREALKQEIDEMKTSIPILEDQLINGVEVKKVEKSE